jgi:hypothetical protein
LPGPRLRHITGLRYSGAFVLYVRFSHVLGTGTTAMFNDRLSFEINAD